MKAMRILSAYLNLAKFFIAAAMICGIFQACSDDGGKEKDQSIFKSPIARPTLLFFLSKNCQECQDELLHILDLHNKYQEFISIIAISPKDELEFLQKEIDKINPRFKLYASVDNKNLLSFLIKMKNIAIFHFTISRVKRL